MNTDELLTAFRAEVPQPDEATGRRAYARAARGRRRAPHRRLVLAVAVVVTAAIAGGLYASLGGAGSDVNPQRQQIVDNAAAEVRQAFGDRRIVNATLDGSVLRVDVKSAEPFDSVLGPFEGVLLAYVADDELRAAGDEGIDTLAGPALGQNPLPPIPHASRLPAGACDIQKGTTLAGDVTAASGRLIHLLGGFCTISLTTSDPKAFAADVEQTLNQLWRAVPATKMSQDRFVALEADDEQGAPVIVGAWEPQGGGAVYVRPGLCTPLVTPPVTLGNSRC